MSPLSTLAVCPRQRYTRITLITTARGPNQYASELWGCKEQFTFPTVKLLEYANREKELEQIANPFGIVVLAHLKTRATRKHPEDRFQWKLRLCRLLYEHGYRKQDIWEILRFIDWLMLLPAELECRFDETMLQYEEEHRMRYVTSFERYFLEKGEAQGERKGRLESSREAILEILDIRFDGVSEVIVEAVNSIDDMPFLKQLHREAVTAHSLDEFLAILDRQPVLA